jgi:Domain of unknown function (DUF4440)
MLVSPKIRVAAVAVLLAASVSATANDSGGGCAFAMVSDLQYELEKHTRAMLNALATGDKAPWIRCLSERALITGDDGQTLTKAEFLAQLRPLPPGYSGHIRMENVRFLGARDAIIVSYDLGERETIFGHTISQRYHTTDTWVIQDGKWYLIASQALKALQRSQGKSHACPIAVRPGGNLRTRTRRNLYRDDGERRTLWTTLGADKGSALTGDNRRLLSQRHSR